LLPVWTLLSGFGSPTATVDGVAFLASWLRLPSDVLEVFLETWTVTRYGQVALSVMGFGFATTLVPLVYFGKLRLHKTRLAGVLAASICLFAVVALGGTLLRPVLLPVPTNPLLALTLDPALVRTAKVALDRASTVDAAFDDPQVTLLAIQKSGVLRVGYDPYVIPFSYWNDRHDLVGLDISYAYRLASDLNVRLELIPFHWPDLSMDLVHRRFDVAMSGIYFTDERLKTVTVSNSYYQSPVALIVASNRATEFLDRDAILAMPSLRLAVFDDPVLVPMLRRLFPNAQIELVPDYSVLPSISDHIDGAIWTLEQASAWAAAHPGFTAVQPAGTGSPILLAYLMPPGAEGLRQYLNQWLDLKSADGFRTAQVDYWINGKSRALHQPRWNLLDYLLDRY
jgi:proton glutamate symport protein